MPFSRLSLALLLALPALSQDLGGHYHATLEYTDEALPQRWQTGVEHAWRLDDFRLNRGGPLTVEAGACRAVFGVHQSSPVDPAANVLWALLVPEQETFLRSELAGDGERIRSMWLRFHPARIEHWLGRADGRLEEGARALVAEGLRNAAWKMGSSWQSGNQPVVPWKRALVLDIETDKARRFFFVENESVKYEAAFEQRRLPDPVPMSPEDAVAAFDEVWSAFDREYPYFEIKDVDWQARREPFRRQAAEATTRYQAMVAIAGILEPLDDLHVYVSADQTWVPLDNRQRPMGANYRGVLARLEPGYQESRDLVYGRTEDGIGYISVLRLSNDKMPEAFDAALEELSDTWALVLDLRFNGGGSEGLAQAVSGRFLEEDVVYGHSRFREPGGAHDEFGPVLPRKCPARGPWRYQSPVVVLQGQRTMSSAEAFVLMMAQAPGVVTMGDRTAGSSANPRRLSLAGGIQVNLPRWKALDGHGNPFEDSGIAPGVPLVFEARRFRGESEPVLDAALEHLRAPGVEKQAGKRD